MTCSPYLSPLNLPPRSATSFVALDVETANPDRDSVCAVGAVRVERGRIVERFSARVRPPSAWFPFTAIHGITWSDVRNEVTFGQLWPRLERFVAGADFLAAHNAPFDRSVLEASCRRWSKVPPPLPFLCTLQLARKRWNLRPARLPDVAAYLDIPLTHHDALSDAEACAQIVLRALPEPPTARFRLVLRRSRQPGATSRG